MKLEPPPAPLARWQHRTFNKHRDSRHRASLTRDTNQCVCDITTLDKKWCEFKSSASVLNEKYLEGTWYRQTQFIFVLFSGFTQHIPCVHICFRMKWHHFARDAVPDWGSLPLSLKSYLKRLIGQQRNSINSSQILFESWGRILFVRAPNYWKRNGLVSSKKSYHQHDLERTLTGIFEVELEVSNDVDISLHQLNHRVDNDGFARCLVRKNVRVRVRPAVEQLSTRHNIYEYDKHLHICKWQVNTI